MFLSSLAVALLVSTTSGVTYLATRPRWNNAQQEETENQLRKYKHEAEQLLKERDALAEEVGRRRDELALISEVAQSLGASTHLRETAQIVLSMIRRSRVPYQSCLVFLGDQLEIIASELPNHQRSAPHSLLLAKAMRDKRPALLEEVQQHNILPDEQSVMLVPLRVRNENLGLIYLGSLRPHTHRPEHLERIKVLADLAAPSLKTALLFGKQVELLDSERETRAAVEAKNRQLGGLQKLGAAIGSSLKLRDTLRAVTDNIRSMIPSAQSIIFLTFGEDGLLKVEHSNSPYGDYLESLSLRPEDGILGRASNFSEALLVENTRGTQTLIHNERSAVVAALRAEGQVLGFLYLGAVAENEFDEEHRQLVTTVAYQMAVAINNARLYEQTRQMAFTDGLTGLYLHRFFQVRLSEEISAAEKAGTSLCLVMVDTDNFKTYNDTLGHPAGDALLKEIATLLKDKVRHSDIVCRYGGDEFALILKDVPKDEAARTCERIRETFQLRFANQGVQVTASIGLACYPSDADNKADLTRKADEALYVSKRGGRNRVSLAPTLN
ncbi:MAG: GGDEF domain-containing protein [Candidatus Eremiobacteraeota bacterium]|nr:GGDEF domain-containing protein [Candidatus Eremiobacteraeota bacterium]MCW5867371.1 GGDEF domain-containing protein [Candidatus Eremiobacteraeota bacterium]